MSYDVKDAVKKLKPYNAESIRPKTMLDSNENPYEPSKIILNNIKERLNSLLLNRYPDPRAYKLCGKLAQYASNGIGADNIMVGAGSDELINIIVSAYLGKGNTIFVPTPTFSMYGIYTLINEGRVYEYKRDDDFNINMDEMIEEVKKVKPKLVVLCNPNNPTGTLTPKEDVIKLIENSGSMVILDEAYYEFSDMTIVDLIDKYDNLIVLRTLSKAWGMAGIRLGYLVAKNKIVDELLKVKSPYNVNAVTQEIASIILDYPELMTENITKIIKEKEFMLENLYSIDNMKIYNTYGNFILVKAPDAEEIYSKLMDKGVAIRIFKGSNELSNCLRITVGTREENQFVIKSFKDWRCYNAAKV
ncbi:histidinol-phosphate aminotransferase 2 [Oxobacter pfennigii]|uniref:Histidinol-phosphate aminotransferase n=1 Tax=Oxobacter pfennigii TaxID=36849 RepID=A0A0P8WAI3_9CLOT|nr:histidinol-phosphate transaminase [Oxobacter pfennigii]KPU44967.1 histidinol-phosphate aminotransferase 2 [Oxobacter pfennigii]